MSRHFWRAWQGEVGFSLVEILVAIMIAGIAFAALVPVFVQAQKSNSSDKARNVALNIAQGKLELIRELDFGQVDSTTLDTTLPGSPPKYLGSPTFHNRDFKPTYEEATGGGTKTFWVRYAVTAVKNAPTDLEAAYKKVRVTVGWDGAPTPLKTAVLETIIYRQWGGPRLVYFTVGPTDADGVIRTTGVIRLKALVDTADIQRTTAVAFTITSGDGIVVPLQTGSLDPSDPTGATWYFDWPTTGVQNDVYTFKAVAYEGIDSGNTAQEVLRYETGPPPAPTGLTGYPGNNTVLLRWDPSAVGDLSHYEIWRIVAADYLPATPIDQQATRIGTVPSQPLYLATGLTNGTQYRFFVRTVDELGNLGGWADCLVTPSNADLTPPAAPADLSISIIGPTVTLNWTPSADAAFYRIYQWNGSAAQLVPGEQGIALGSTKTISQGYSKTGYYQVRAVDSAANEQPVWCTLRALPATPFTIQGGITWATAVTAAPPQYNMTLQNALLDSARVTVVWLQDGVDTVPARQVTITSNTQITPGQTKDLRTQYAGLYRVTWDSNGTGPTSDGSEDYTFNSAARIQIPLL